MENYQALEWIYNRFRTRFIGDGFNSSKNIPVDFDLVLNGYIDSLQFVLFVCDIEKDLGVKLNFSDLDSQISTIQTILGAINRRVDDRASIGRSITVDNWCLTLEKLGISAGDTLIIHSAIQRVGDFENGLDGVYDGLLKILGSAGTIIVPAANIPAFRYECFCPISTACDRSLGVFSEFVRNKEGALRSFNPFDAVAAIGPSAFDVIRKPNRQAYGPDSPWRNALELDAKILFLGVDLYFASIVHVAEVDCKVPYRSWKTFSGRVAFDGQPTDYEVELYARDQNIEYDFARLHQIASVSTLLQSIPTWAGGIFSVPARELHAAVSDVLRNYPNFLRSSNNVG